MRRAWVAAGAVTLVVAALASYAPTNAAFTGITRNPGNTWTAAAAACASPSSATLNPADWTHVREAYPTDTFGTGSKIFVGSGTGQTDRGLLKFSLPALGAGCSLTTASLRLKVSVGASGRTLEVRTPPPPGRERP
jgi:hypothetical protein